MKNYEAIPNEDDATYFIIAREPGAGDKLVYDDLPQDKAYQLEHILNNYSRFEA